MFCPISAIVVETAPGECTVEATVVLGLHATKARPERPQHDGGHEDGRDETEREQRPQGSDDVLRRFAVGHLTVAVVGGGPWGIALATAASRAGSKVVVTTRRPVAPSSSGVLVTDDLSAVASAELILLLVPSNVARGVAVSLLPHLRHDHIIVHSSRGLVGPALRTISEVFCEETPVTKLGVVGGPALASEILADEPSVVVCGATDDDVASAFVRAFKTPRLRVYTTNDLSGVEWASALVGCMTIVVGYAQRIGLRAGTIAALITRCMREAAEVVVSGGGKARTTFGLAGIGDLLASSSQPDRPEILLGAALARGVPIAEAVRVVKQRVEAVALLPRLVPWARLRKLRVPILSAIQSDIFAGRPAERIIEDLMTLPVQDTGAA
jgi:glycerol-3-phosphate dehydrogenase (NAD(P)+)